MPSQDRQRELLAAIRGKRVCIVGDLMLDRFIYGDAERLSPEAPVPVVRLSRRSAQPGGAANVAANVQSLAGEALLLGAAGSDEAGAELITLLGKLGVGSSTLSCHAGYQTTLKTRVVARGQQLLRIDEEDPDAYPEAARFGLRKLFAELAGSVDVLAISDYGKGCLDARLARELISHSQAQGIPVIVDPKPASIRLFAAADVVKPNLAEARRIASDADTGTDGQGLCEAVLEASQASAVAVTAGPVGMYVLAQGQYRHIRGHLREVFDVAGAGDSTLAAMALALAAGADVFEAAWMGNLAGSIAVSHPGVVAVKAAEMQAEIEAAHGRA